MTSQPQWNKYEAALLLEAVNNVELGMENRKEAIARVSNALRQMANNQGVCIDSTYRNVNGITFQFQSMEHAVYGRISSVKKVGSKLFKEIAELKDKKPDEYESMLKQAYLLIDKPRIGMTADTMESNMNYKDSFRKWLLENDKKESSVNWIIENFDKLSDYAKEKKVSTQEVWEIQDTKQFATYVNNLQSYKFFRVFKKNLFKFLQGNTKLYVSFLKDKQISPMTTALQSVSADEYIITDADEELGYKYPEVLKQVYLVLKEDNKHAYLTSEQIQESIGSLIDATEEVLNGASWSEKLGDGFVFGQNKTVYQSKKINLNADRAYSSDTDIDTVILSAFRRGFRPSSIMDRKRFANIYEEKHGCTIDDDEVLHQIKTTCFSFDERYFLPKALVDKTIADSILKYIEQYFETRDILFYDVIYEYFKSDFNSFIYSSEMLCEYIKATFNGTALYFNAKYFSYKHDVKPDITSDVENYLISADRPCSYDEIYNELSHIKRDDIYSVLHYNNPQILGNSKTEYFHVDVAHISKAELAQVEEACDKLLVNSKYITCNEIIEKLDYINSELSDRLNGKFSTLGIRRILTYYLRDKFDVMTGVITPKGKQMTIADVFADFARTYSKFTVDDIQALSEYTGTVPYWESVQSNAIRINKDEFVSDDMLDFDIETIDNAIAFYCDSYLPLSSITDFMRFPSCGYPWNIYLLQQYVYRSSKGFKLEFLGFAKGTACGVIVKKQLDFPDFESVVVDALSKTSITSKDDALGFLCEKGFISDRRYKKTEELLKKAIVVRKKNSEK